MELGYTCTALHCFQKWQNRWGRCIQAQDDYIEGDGGN